ncbi:hypothetical protein ZOSMA_106G00640 [Zostera marina]|uniref:Uncharacterized protein n=1 Tax=Zostera marina TaxID=29655 RepID=A0A0K9Q4G9_ZOSMR|nr:hypothetical protein ZOSMA_106G00640 [Zostera marina]
MRFINAKAQFSTERRRKIAEKSLCRLSDKLLELRSSVSVKKMEIERTKQMKDLSDMLQTEMPFLEE